MAFLVYVSPEGYHRHQCQFCAFVWEHHDCNDKRHGDKGAHECPACHRCNWSLGIYDGPAAPVVRNGDEPTVQVLEELRSDGHTAEHKARPDLENLDPPE